MDAACGADLADAMIASPAWPTLAARLRVLDAAGIDSPTVLAQAAAGRGFDDADDIAAVLHWRLRGAATNARLVVGDTFSDLTPTSTGSELDTAIAQIAAAMDARTRHLGHQVQTERPAWADQLGPLPDQPDHQDAWRHRAAIVAGYQETFGLDPTGADPIGAIPPTVRPDARAWWQRAAAALDRTDPPTMAHLPDEQLEAIIEQCRHADRNAPAAVADELRDATRQLRQARTAHGLAIRNGDPVLAHTAHDQLGQLNRTVADLEEAHRRRQQWTAISSRLHQQADSALVELDIRRSAQADRPRVDTNLADLRRRLIHAQARLQSMQATVEHVERVADQRRVRAAQLEAELAALLASHPATQKAQLVVTSEQATAARIDQLRHTLTDTMLGIHTLRGKPRQQLRSELDELVTDHPALATPGHRQNRWETILKDGRQADRDHARDLRRQITHAHKDVVEHAALATACRTECNTRETIYTDLATAITRRTGATSAHPKPSGPSTATTVIPAETPATPRSTAVNPDRLQQHRAAIDPPAHDGPTLEA